MILIGLGANLDSLQHGPPRETLEAALTALGGHGIEVTRRSRWYESPPLPPSRQPWFINGVALVTADLGPDQLLAALLTVEAGFGRARRRALEARTIDLDLLAYGERICGHDAPRSGTGNAGGNGGGLTVPHPRLHERLFVLRPLAELAPDWRHPVLGRTVTEMIADLPADPRIRPVDGKTSS